MKPRTTAGRLAAWAALAGALAFAPSLAQEATPQAGAAGAAAALTSTQVQARMILMRMATYLANAPAFSVNLLSSYDVVQSTGQKIEFLERRKVIVKRPDRLRVEVEHSDNRRTTIVFTGKEIVLVDVTNKVYATAPQPGGLDESILRFVSDFGMRLPLAVLLMRRLPVDLERRVREIDYVEKTNLLGTPSHHLAARGDTVDMQVWVADGAQPVPLRIVLTYKYEPGQPEFRASFMDWNMSPKITEATFRPDIPSGSRKVQFAAQLAAAARARQGGKR